MQTVLVVANAMRQHNVSLSVIDPVGTLDISRVHEVSLTATGHGLYQWSSATSRESGESTMHRNPAISNNLYSEHS